MPYKNKEDKTINAVKYRKENKEKIKASIAVSRAKNPIKYALLKKVWKKNNPDKVKSSSLSYRERNKDLLSEKNREYQKRNSDLINIKTHRRRAVKAKAKGTYTFEQWVTLCNKYRNVCLCCLKSTKLTPDHVVPLSLGGRNSIENIQPLCGSCNSRKSTKTIDFRINFDLNTTQVHMEHETPKTLSMYVGRGEK